MNIFNVATGLHRGSRPESPVALGILASNYGVKTIISLETDFGAFWDSLVSFRFDEGACWQDWWKKTFIRHPLSNFLPPTRFETMQILDDINRSLLNGGVFVHCYSGVDRTGWIIAAYRVIEEEMHPEDAWAEAVKMGMHFRYFWWKSAFIALFPQ